MKTQMKIELVDEYVQLRPVQKRILDEGGVIIHMRVATELALVLLWHYQNTPYSKLPGWCIGHPAWPGKFGGNYGHLLVAALPLIQKMETEHT